jgi:hypothetical protein
VTRWQKILLLGECGVAAVAVCAWLFWGAFATKPITVGLSEQTTLTLYAMTRGPDATFPEPGPGKRLVQVAHRVIANTHTRVQENWRLFDEKTVFWWFKLNQPLPSSIELLPHHTTVSPATSDFPPGDSGMIEQATGSQLVGVYLSNCPTNEPTMVINFMAQETKIMNGERYTTGLFTNITVPNPAYQR